MIWNFFLGGSAKGSPSTEEDDPAAAATAGALDTSSSSSSSTTASKSASRKGRRKNKKKLRFLGGKHRQNKKSKLHLPNEIPSAEVEEKYGLTLPPEGSGLVWCFRDGKAIEILQPKGGGELVKWEEDYVLCRQVKIQGKEASNVPVTSYRDMPRLSFGDVPGSQTHQEVCVLVPKHWPALTRKPDDVLWLEDFHASFELWNGRAPTEDEIKNHRYRVAALFCDEFLRNEKGSSSEDSDSSSAEAEISFVLEEYKENIMRYAGVTSRMLDEVLAMEPKTVADKLGKRERDRFEEESGSNSGRQDKVSRSASHERGGKGGRGFAMFRKRANAKENGSSGSMSGSSSRSAASTAKTQKSGLRPQAGLQANPETGKKVEMAPMAGFGAFPAAHSKPKSAPVAGLGGTSKARGKGAPVAGLKHIPSDSSVGTASITLSNASSLSSRPVAGLGAGPRGSGGGRPSAGLGGTARGSGRSGRPAGLGGGHASQQGGKRKPVAGLGGGAAAASGYMPSGARSTTSSVSSLSESRVRKVSFPAATAMHEIYV